MCTEDRTKSRGEALLVFLSRTLSWHGLVALPYFVISASIATNDILSAVRTGLVSSEMRHVASAAMTIARWAKLVQDDVLQQEVPRPLVEQLVATIETRQETGLQAMLSAALSLLKDDAFTGEDLNRLMNALEKIRLEFRYESVDFVGVRAVSLSLIRAECVKLSRRAKASPRR
jgi:hypothetical protein